MSRIDFYFVAVVSMLVFMETWAAGGGKPVNKEIRTPEAAFSVYVEWIKTQPEKSVRRHFHVNLPPKLNEPKVGSPVVQRSKANDAINFVQSLLKNNAHAIRYGRLENLPAAGEVWKIKFENHLNGGSITYLDPKTGLVLLVATLVEG
ncbi:MAG: hypothetical protein AB7P04_15675 [Bacteriovoracia bacterium]